MKTYFFILIVGLVIGFSSCEKEEKPVVDATTVPQILGSKVSRPVIKAFIQDTCTLYVYAKGGNLKYNWEVDLGEITPIAPGKVIYSGSPCCVGLKEIKCTVSNEKGSKSISLIVNLEP